MEVKFNKQDSTLTVAISGNIDTVTAPELDTKLQENLSGIKDLILDFAAVDYISSAGLRVILMANQQLEDADGTMTIKNANDDVRDVFEMTGFDSLLNLD
ncbi:MAG: STAS domain-containing protein [Lentisphaeria bacterium]|jgi:anti-sigma B factor antagonist|nr:STAS domain-containing protein [Lentisphaerota bacterium]MBO5680189.1 STAS domain-containing protein [Lentisphaeria bacterium]MBO5694719.1 STAS domain-containing protein [Lentisphaeria bacterium]